MNNSGEYPNHRRHRNAIIPSNGVVVIWLSGIVATVASAEHYFGWWGAASAWGVLVIVGATIGDFGETIENGLLHLSDSIRERKGG